MACGDLAGQCKVMLHDSGAGVFSHHLPEAGPATHFFANVFFRALAVFRKMEVTLVNRKDDDIRVKRIEPALVVENVLLVLPVSAFIQVDVDAEFPRRKAQHRAQLGCGIAPEERDFDRPDRRSPGFLCIALKQCPACLPGRKVIACIDDGKSPSTGLRIVRHLLVTSRKFEAQRSRWGSRHALQIGLDRLFDLTLLAEGVATCLRRDR